MNSARKTSLLLLVMDLTSLLVIFNAISHFRGLTVAEHFMALPLVLPAAAVVFGIYLIEGYSARTDMMGLDYTSLHVIALFGAMLFTLLLAYVILPAGYELQSSRSVVALSYLALTPVTLGYRRLIYLRNVNRRGARSWVFLGDAASCQAFATECQKMGSTQTVIYCTMSDEDAGRIDPNLGVALQPFEQVLNRVESGEIPAEAIVLRESSRDLRPTLSRQLVRLFFSGVPTYTLELFQQVYWRKIPLYRLNQTWLFQEGFQIAREPVFERIKRMSDIALAGIALVLASPLIALAALAVWTEDHGPVFFAQTRIGKNHQPFRIYKLRTMRPNDGKGDPYTRKGDSRVTRVGRFLRASRLDEFPQLWNVLRGDMSLIGPRAEWDRLVEDYEREISCYHFRHLVKPGITGWAQVNYPYGANMEDTLRKLEYDLYYIRHFSFVLDAAIVLKTIHIMLFGKGR